MYFVLESQVGMYSLYGEIRSKSRRSKVGLTLIAHLPYMNFGFTDLLYTLAPQVPQKKILIVCEPNPYSCTKSISSQGVKIF